MIPPPTELSLHGARRAAALIAAADALLLTTGAVMGVDSGLPDFRGPEGFWRAYPELGRAGIDFITAASPATFHRDPHLAWGFYSHRLALYRRTLPHAGYDLLRRWGQAKPHGAGSNGQKVMVLGEPRGCMGQRVGRSQVIAGVWCK